MAKAQNLDPLDVNNRLYRQIARLLDALEKQDMQDPDGVTVPQRINALIAVGRIQIMFANLRKAATNDPADAGSAVRKYAAAFAKPNAARGRASNARPAFEPIGPIDDEPESDGDGGGDEAA